MADQLQGAKRAGIRVAALMEANTAGCILADDAEEIVLVGSRDWNVIRVSMLRPHSVATLRNRLCVR